jgi:DeoR family suf operon transcriptional repressor
MPRRPPSRREPTISDSLAGAASLLGTARGQILSALCGRRLTAIELADRFSVSSNAIRIHLDVLRRAQLVRYDTESRGVGKPTHVYELTPEGQYVLSRAYAPALSYLFRAARTHLGDRVVDIVRDAGRELAVDSSPRAARNGSLRSRAESCVALLRSFGGSAQLEDDASGFLIRSECCPLSSVVTEQPVACKLFEGMAREITGRDVEERCERTRRPHCLFVIPRTPAH